MPEIKHNFTGGKMNKDLDERLIPNGQYRDAMNIQVSTSEGSDVGTAQNIMGNSIIPGQGFISSDAVCVGSVADEKNDKLYWFVINYDNTEYITNGTFDGSSSGWLVGQPLMGGTEVLSPLTSQGWSYSGNNSVTATNVEQFISLVQRDVQILDGKTYVIKCDITNFSGTGDLTPVIVGQNGIWTRPGGSTYVGGSNVDYQQYAVNGDGTWSWTLRASVASGASQEIAYQPAGWIPYLPNQIYFSNRADTSGSSNLLNCTIDNISIKGVDNSCIVQYDTKTNTVIPVFVDVDNTVLRLNPSKLITGVNIIDDLLLWTDNNSEPKKINIPRSIQGTDPRGHTNTYLINPSQNFHIHDQMSIKEEHITVVRKSPKHPPTIQYETFRDTNKDYTGIIKISDNIENSNSFLNSSIGRMHDFSFIDVGDTFSTIIETDINNSNTFSLEWEVGSKVVLKEFDFDNVSPTIPITNYRIKGTITDWIGNSFTNTNYLLTLNGDLSEGSGNIPTAWGLQTHWTWDQSLGTLECDGTTASQSFKAFNNNDNRDIVVGGRYKVKYTITDPPSGEMVGKVNVLLYDSDSIAAPSGNYMVLGSHTIPGTFEHEFVFDDTFHTSGPLPLSKGPSAYSHAAYLNSILFYSTSDGTSSLGPQLMDAFEFTSTTVGTWAGVGPYNILSSGLPFAQWIHNTWEIPYSNRVIFHRQFIDDAAHAGASNQNTVYMNNLMEESLVVDEEYAITLTMSDMSFQGSGWQAIGLSTNGGVPGNIRFSTSSGSATQATGSDPWNGLGGQVTETFTATSNSRIDLFAARTGGISSTAGPSGDMTVSIKQVVTNGFGGTVSNVSVEELDETVARVEIKVDSIDGIPPNVEENEVSLNYAIDLLDEEEKLFEFKFPRFAYRYKYEDGEYSTISPFSEISFIPGGFDYHPKKSYNLGMTNNIKSLTIKDYCRELPQDVSGIDILYKEEHSPNIYIVDDVKDIHTRWSSYKIKHETIKNGLLSSNQLLRPWDNVPKKALGQEIVGNRVVYGNYLQNYNLTDNITNKNYDISIDSEFISEENKSKTGKKSIKSLRDYQIGVVFSDEYGRETPVMTSSKATMSVNKANSAGVNQLIVSINNEGHPVNMKFFKFFIKDTGGDYYNLAMDRFYDAEDDNIWLAFPSTDRNKVDIDDFLILKKGAGSVIKDPKTGKLNNVIQEKAQYKIIDIKNEAPDFIKRKETRIAHIRHVSTSKLFKDSDLPVVNDINFAIEHNKIASSSYAKLHEDFGKNPDVEYHISLSNTNTSRVSDRYKIIELYGDESGGTPTWYFTLETPFNSEVNDFTNDETGVNSTEIIDDTYLNIYRTAIDKSASHKFDGRFFVKIYNDDIFARALKDKVDDIKKEYKTTGVSRKIYSLETHDGNNRIKKLFDGASTTLAFKGINVGGAGSEGLHDDVSNDSNSPFHLWPFYYQATKDFSENIGTLNNKKKTILSATTSIIVHDPLRDPDVWRDYDAYFRGINVYLDDNAIKDRVTSLDIHDTNSSDQKFQDVWFIDKAINAANFHYSTVSGKDTGWDTFPSITSWNSMGLRSWSTGEKGSSEIELSFGGIQPIEWSKNKTGWDRDESFYDLAGENYNYSEKEGDFIKNIAIGSQFRFKEDPDHTIYTITDVNIYLRVRYESLRHYGGPYTNNNTEEGESNDLYPNHLFPFHAKARTGTATGMTDVNTGTSSNVLGIMLIDGNSLETQIDAKESDIIFATNSYLRPSNYTKNWRIRVDKAFNDYWNPVEDTGDQITSSNPIKLTATGSGHNYISTTSIIGSGTIVNGDNINNLSVGMVLKKYDDTSGGDTDTMSPACIVSKIEKISSVSYKIWFKTYDGSSDFGASGEGTPADIATGDTLYFYQYPMNGLSPNAAKNLNFFRDGKGFGANGTTGKAGTDAIGYTWEWLEEKSARSEEEILPTNPAVWETKAKENTDLDVYYEATGSIPIYAELTRENMLELIPIGSTIEHEGSRAIPHGTKVYDVNPDTEEIILTKNIQINEASTSEIYLAWLQSFGYTPGTVPFAGGAGGKIICTELCEQGLLSREVLELDYQHSDNNMDMATKIGYWKWAAPVVSIMQESKIITQIIRPFGVAWAYEMAHREEPQNYSGNILGKLIMAIGVPICRYIGNREISKNNIHI